MKGSASDIFFSVSVLFGMLIVTLFGFTFWNNFNTSIRNSGLNTTYTENLNAKMSEALSIIDYAIPFAFISLSLLSLASAAFVKAHPAFFFVFLMLNIILIFATDLMMSIYNQMKTTELGSVANQLTFTNLFIEYLPKVNVVLMLMMAVVIYAKP